MTGAIGINVDDMRRILGRGVDHGPLAGTELGGVFVQKSIPLEFEDHSLDLLFSRQHITAP